MSSEVGKIVPPGVFVSFEGSYIQRIEDFKNSVFKILQRTHSNTSNIPFVSNNHLQEWYHEDHSPLSEVLMKFVDSFDFFESEGMSSLGSGGILLSTCHSSVYASLRNRYLAVLGIERLLQNMLSVLPTPHLYIHVIPDAKKCAECFTSEGAERVSGFESFLKETTESISEYLMGASEIQNLRVIEVFPDSMDTKELEGLAERIASIILERYRKNLNYS